MLYINFYYAPNNKHVVAVSITITTQLVHKGLLEFRIRYLSMLPTLMKVHQREKGGVFAA